MVVTIDEYSVTMACEKRRQLSIGSQERRRLTPAAVAVCVWAKSLMTETILRFGTSSLTTVFVRTQPVLQTQPSEYACRHFLCVEEQLDVATDDLSFRQSRVHCASNFLQKSFDSREDMRKSFVGRLFGFFGLRRSSSGGGVGAARSRRHGPVGS